MAPEHFIPGKDASLEASIEILHGKLRARGFHVEEHSWLNPVENIWSVHVRERDCPLLFTNGKGASRLAALASALGEFLERLSCNYFWADFYLGDALARRGFAHYPDERWFPPESDGDWPAGLLTPELRELYDPEGTLEAEALVELNSGAPERGICALPYRRERDGATVWFPVNLIGNLYVSNGMSAGNSRPEARAQALSEIFERHVKFRIIAEGLCLPQVPDSVIAGYPKLAADVQALREAGFGIQVRDASLGGRYPVMNVTLLNPHDQGCFASFGAHPRFEIALERALTELLQGRALEALEGFPAPTFEVEEAAEPENLETHFIDSSGVIAWRFLGERPDFSFHHWNFSETTEEDCAWLIRRVHADGRDVYIADYEHLGVYACRILVPGMSEIYPVDELEWENSNVGNRLRPLILRLPALGEDECAELLGALDELALPEERPLAALIGLAPDAGSFWEDLRVGELRTLLGLALGDESLVREGCDWVGHFAQIDPRRRRVYRCIECLLGLETVEPFGTALAELFGTETVATARALLSGELRFFGVPALGEELAGCSAHRRLLEAYDKLHGPA